MIGFTELFYSHNCQAPTHIIDGNGFKFGLRSFRHQSVTPGFVEALLRRIDDFAYACKITPPKTAHQRGNFAQILLGKSHGRGAGENVSQRSIAWINNASLTTS